VHAPPTGQVHRGRAALACLARNVHACMHAPSRGAAQSSLARDVHACACANLGAAEGLRMLLYWL
jgi:hypothetical protein